MRTNIDTGIPFFANVVQRPMTTSAGPCDLPILYSDASLLTLVYGIAPDLARTQVDSRGFEPIVLFGKAWVALCAFEYRKTTIGPYGELGLGVLVKRMGTSPSLTGLLRDQRKVRDAGLFVTSLPVTTANARAAGFELWGFPKYQTGIETSFQKDRVRIVLERELEISLKRGFHVTTSGLPLCLCSLNRDDEVIRTVVETESKIEWGGAQSVSITMQGDGPTASKMRALGLDAQKPALAFVTDHMKAILPLGENMGALAMEVAAAAQ
jgi:hypothetical protein